MLLSVDEEFGLTFVIAEKSDIRLGVAKLVAGWLNAPTHGTIDFALCWFGGSAKRSTPVAWFIFPAG
jgi:hypothetical protein